MISPLSAGAIVAAALSASALSTAAVAATMEPYETPKSLLVLDRFTEMNLEAYWRDLVEECIRASKGTGATSEFETGDTSD